MESASQSISSIDWEKFLSENETLLGIKDFLINLLVNISYKEFTLNVMQYKPELLTNPDILYTLLVTVDFNNRLPVHELLKITAKNHVIYNRLFTIEHIWSKIYKKLIPYSKFIEQNTQLSNLEMNTELIYKLCIHSVYYILPMPRCYHFDDEDNLSNTSINVKVQQLIYTRKSPLIKTPKSREELSSHRYAGKLMIDDDIRRICISNYAVYTLNSKNIVTEYRLDMQYQYEYEIYQKMIQKHLNERIVIKEVKEMLNIKPYSDNIQHGTGENIEQLDNIIIVLTYDGELFLHTLRDNISYTCKFNMQYMKLTYGFDKVLNIQKSEEINFSTNNIVIEAEDHSLFSIDVRYLYRRLVGVELPVISDNIDNVNAEFNNFEIIRSKDNLKPHCVTQILPNSHLNVGMEGLFQPIMKLATSREFESEINMTWEQKTHSKSPRVYTCITSQDDCYVVFYFDNEIIVDVNNANSSDVTINTISNNNHLFSPNVAINTIKGTMFMSYVKEYKTHDNRFQYTNGMEVNLSQHNSYLSYNTIQEMDIIITNATNLNNRSIHTYGKILLNMKNGSKYSQIEILPEEKTYYSGIRYINENTIIKSIANVKSEFQVFTFNIKPKPESNNKIKELVFTCGDPPKIINDVKHMLYEDFTKSSHIIDGNSRLIFVSKLDSETFHGDLVEENAVQILDYGAEQYSDMSLMVKIKPNNQICVPYEQYIQSNFDDITKIFVLDNNEILFRRSNSPYNFRVIRS